MTSPVNFLLDHPQYIGLGIPKKVVLHTFLKFSIVIVDLKLYVVTLLDHMLNLNMVPFLFHDDRMQKDCVLISSCQQLH